MFSLNLTIKMQWHSETRVEFSLNLTMGVHSAGFVFLVGGVLGGVTAVWLHADSSFLL